MTERGSHRVRDGEQKSEGGRQTTSTSDSLRETTRKEERDNTYETVLGETTSETMINE